MIFFVIDDNRRDDVGGITDPEAFEAAFPALSAPRLIAWNEVFPEGDPVDVAGTLGAAIWAAAEHDSECQAVLAACRTTYGLDPAAPGPSELETAVTETLGYWAHPRIGNVSADWNEPPVRPLGRDSVDSRWASTTFLDERSVNAIRRLDTALRRPRRSARDQVRICHHIIDLARAFIGEMTTWAPKRAEKALALELCLSAGLKADLVELLSVLDDSFRVWAADASLAATEYCRYYLGGVLGPDDGRTVEEELAMLRALWHHAIDRPVTRTPLFDQVLPSWSTLPPVIRCAILVNDLRRLLVDSSGSSGTLSGTRRIGDEAMYGFGPHSGPIPLRIRDARKNHSGWRFVDRWTRDERHPATLSARRLLTPTWAGPSGHVAKNRDFYRARLEADCPDSVDHSIPAALFALWRLYYDRRYSPSHTLVESCEGTTGIGDLGRIRRPLPVRGAADDDDPYALFRRNTLPVELRRMSSPTARRNARRPGDPARFVDGFAILELTRRRYGGTGEGATMDAATSIALGAKVDEWRGRVTAAGYTVPRWSHEVSSGATGFRVTAFRPPDAPRGRRRTRVKKRRWTKEQEGGV